ATEHDVRLPDGPGGAPGPPGHLPQVRHGAGTGAAEPGRGRQPRAARLLPPLLVDPAADRGRVRAWHVWPPAAVVRPGHPELDRTAAVHAGGALGRGAVLRARLAVAAQPQPEHGSPEIGR